MIRPQIFVTYALPAPVLARLAQVCDYRIGSQHSPLERSALLAGVRDAHGIVSLITDRIDREVIEAGQHVRIIANVGVGYNNVDVAAARQRGIVVSNTPDVLTDSTADLTWGLILAVTRRIVEADVFTRASRFTGWDFELLLGSGLNGKTLGIIGYGRIGRAVARRATGFGMNVLYCGRDEVAFRDDPPREVGIPPQPTTSTLTASARLDGLSARRVGFHRLLEQADIVTLHIPLAAVSRHLINRPALGHMKPTAYLINTSRGEIVDETALVEALESGRIAGAGLDVYEQEPAVSPQLLQMPNVVLLPHIGSATTETRTAMAMLAVENVIDLFSGQNPRNAI